MKFEKRSCSTSTNKHLCTEPEEPDGKGGQTKAGVVVVGRQREKPTSRVDERRGQ